MRSEAQRNAESKYRKGNVKQFVLKFYPDDMELYEHLCTKENRNDYLRQLIRNDMERGK